MKTVHNARRMINANTLLLLLILGATLAAGSFLLRLDDERNARLQIDSTVEQALATLESLRLEEATLTERAATLPSSSLAPRLPSRAEAFRLGETFTAYVAEQRLALSAFASTRMGSTGNPHSGIKSADTAARCTRRALRRSTMRTVGAK